MISFHAVCKNCTCCSRLLYIKVEYNMCSHVADGVKKGDVTSLFSYFCPAKSLPVLKAQHIIFASTALSVVVFIVKQQSLLLKIYLTQ